MKCNADIKCEIDLENLMFVFKEDLLSRCYKQYEIESYPSSPTRLTDISMRVIDISLYDTGYLDVEWFSNDRHGTKMFGQKTVCKNLLEKCEKISTEKYTDKKNEFLKKLTSVSKEDLLSRCYKEKNELEAFSSFMKVIDVSLCYTGYIDVEWFGNDGHGTKVFGKKLVSKNLFEDYKQTSNEEYTAKKIEFIKKLGINAGDIKLD